MILAQTIYRYSKSCLLYHSSIRSLYAISAKHTFALLFSPVFKQIEMHRQIWHFFFSEAHPNIFKLDISSSLPRVHLIALALLELTLKNQEGGYQHQLPNGVTRQRCAGGWAFPSERLLCSGCDCWIVFAAFANLKLLHAICFSHIPKQVVKFVEKIAMKSIRQFRFDGTRFILIQNGGICLRLQRKARK